ncbi:uncharacterized protein [Lepeophtheirus salmonis]|uniref:uncharacterized protein n=1 Tax=Lepeophtheirus salmonis TaxID=72036 RepID=UPI001AE2F7F5|nr:uncharacterized protein LOC121122373 [Lepeophtheirus salmonis]
MQLTAVTILCLLPWLNILTHSHKDEDSVDLHTIDPEGNDSKENCGCPERYICNKEDNKCYYFPSDITEKSHTDLLKDYKAYIKQKEKIMEQFKNQKKIIKHVKNKIKDNIKPEIEDKQSLDLDEMEEKSENSSIEQNTKKESESTSKSFEEKQIIRANSNKLNNDSTLQNVKNTNLIGNGDLQENESIPERNELSIFTTMVSQKIPMNHFRKAFTQISLIRLNNDFDRHKSTSSEDKETDPPKTSDNMSRTSKNKKNINVTKVCIHIGKNLSNVRCVYLTSFNESLCNGNQSSICGNVMTCHQTKNEGSLRCGPTRDNTLACDAPQCKKESSICLHFDNATSECLQKKENINEENCGSLLCPPASTCVFIPTDGIHPASAFCILQNTYAITRGLDETIMETNTILHFLFRNWMLNSFIF